MIEFLNKIGIDLLNAWILTALFGLTNLVLVNLFRKKYSGRLLHMPKFNSPVERILGLISILSHIGIIIASLFFSLNIPSLWFIIGIIIFGIGYICYLMAMFTYALTDPETPVTTGIYRISRHPMQIMTIIMFLGIGIITKSIIIISLAILIIITTYPTLKAQERECKEKYGDAYQAYLDKTPRYLLFF